MEETEFVVIFGSFAAFKLATEEERIFDSSIDKVEVMNGIYAQIYLFGF